MTEHFFLPSLPQMCWVQFHGGNINAIKCSIDEAVEHSVDAYNSYFSVSKPNEEKHSQKPQIDIPLRKKKIGQIRNSFTVKSNNLSL